MMPATDRRGKSVGGMVGFGDLRETEKEADHLLHLSLVRPGGPGHGLLNGGGRIILEGNTGLNDRETDDAPRLGDRKGRGHVAKKEKGLHTAEIGLPLLDESAYTLMDGEKAPVDGLLGRGFEAAVAEVAETASSGLKKSPSDRSESGVDAEDTKGRSRSGSGLACSEFFPGDGQSLIRRGPREDWRYGRRSGRRRIPRVFR